MVWPNKKNADRPPEVVGCWRLWDSSLFVVAIVSLSGPGRLDIIDGQPRYEVARSLVEHGDPMIRDPDVTFCVLPGRDGCRYSSYRLPQSLAGVAAIWSADATGSLGEMRRQFFFTLTSAVACGILATLYALWFRRLEHSPVAAIGWALAGIFCTPNWFYGTSVFDDILGTTAVVLALTLAWYSREGKPRLFAGLAGLALGLAFNCKQPLGLFVLPVLTLIVQPGQSWRTRLVRMGLVLFGLGAGLLGYEGYEWYKFPPGSTAEHPRLLAQYVPPWPGTPWTAFLVLLVSPAAGVFWYCPTLVLSLLGLGSWLRCQKLFTLALLVACAGFTAFICSLTFFKGDLSWGPRYLTPVFAVLWIFVPAAAAIRSRLYVRVVLALGLLVQVLGLSVDFHRLYVEQHFPSGFWLPGRLRTLKHLVRQIPRVRMVVHPAWFIDACGRRLGVWRCPLPTSTDLDPGLMVERLLVQNFFAMPAPLVAREAALQVGGLDDSLWYTADWDFWLSLAAGGGIVHYPSALAAFRIHGSSQTLWGPDRATEMHRQIEHVL